MNDQLLGYLLNSLDAETHRQVEEYVKRTPEARERLRQLELALEPLGADRGVVVPPRDLVMRTLGRVAEHCCRELPHAPVPLKIRTTASLPTFWRRADVLAAAAILLTVLGFGVPWVFHLRQQAIFTECQNNLAKFYYALKTYSDTHDKHFPNVADAAPKPRNIAGLVVPMLHDAGIATDTLNVRCPANGSAVRVSWTLNDLKQMDEGQFDQLKSKLVLCYAYSLGYRQRDAVITSLEYDPNKPLGSLPIMADGPPRGAPAGNSPNHGGKGQNVLYADGSVKFCTTRDVGFERDDIFLDFDKKVRAGRSWKDTVLAPSEVNP